MLHEPYLWFYGLIKESFWIYWPILCKCQCERKSVSKAISSVSNVEIKSGVKKRACTWLISYVKCTIQYSGSSDLNCFGDTKRRGRNISCEKLLWVSLVFPWFFFANHILDVWMDVHISFTILSFIPCKIRTPFLSLLYFILYIHM
jgi:hypothetical protein